MFEKGNKKAAVGVTILTGMLATACGPNNKVSANCGQGQTSTETVLTQPRNMTTGIGAATLRSLGRGEFVVTYDPDQNNNQRIRVEHGEYKVTNDKDFNVIVASVGTQTHRVLYSDNNEHFQVLATQGEQSTTSFHIETSCS